MVSQLDFPPLVEKMKGQRTTNGYDVLVSYSEDKINQLLEARSRDLASILDIGPLTITGEWPFGDPFTLSLSMKLDHPRLQFQDDHGNIILTFGVKEGHFEDVDTKRTKDLPKHLELSFKTTLTNVTGTVESGFAQPGVKTTPVNRTVTLNPAEKDVAQGVCITFEKASLDIVSTTGQKTTGLAMLKAGLQEYFQDNAELKYYVAGVSNQYQSEAGSHVLRPHSFSFATYSGKTNDDTSVLCMQIKVAQDADRKAASLGDNPWSLFNANGLCPIPRGSTCSIIIQGGFILAGAMKASDVKIPAMHKDEELMGGLGRKIVDVEAMQFSPSQPKTKITFDGAINTKSNEVKYTSDKQRVNRFENLISDGHGAPTRGKTNLEFSWTAKGSWKDKSNPDHPNLLGFDWVGDDSWKIEVPKEDHPWWEALFGFGTELPEPYKKLQVPSPDVKLEMKTLDYFLTTNLLYPGKHVFKADDPSSKSTDRGLALPHDLILTGQTLTS